MDIADRIQRIEAIRYTIAPMAAQQLGPENGSLEIHTYREGMAQKLGHDLIIEVERWDATVEHGPDGAVASVRLNADSGSLQVREGHNGAKALSDKDRRDIKANIDQKILRGTPITFVSTAVEPRAGGLTVRGDLTLADATRPAAFDVDVTSDGRVGGRLPVTQTEWDIKPYKALMGALKVRDTIEIVLDVRVPTLAA